jgi:beta-glucosidase
MANAFPFLDPDLPLDQRVRDLVGRLTLEEKIDQMLHENNPVGRLGVPAYNWWNEACHGVGRNGRATVFPQVIGLGATWNRALVRRVASVISDEARAKHHAAIAAGRRGQYQGLTFWTPNINIFRDPRWGRGQETFGEDPYLTGELGVAMVRGLQGDHGRYLKAAACAKHYAVHSGPERERHGFDARPTQKDLFETYLPAFEKLVRAGVEAVMGAYNRTLGEPCCGSKLLLVDVLRGRWGFRGHVVSDCGALDDIHIHHKVTRNAAESAALAVHNGCDLNCGRTYHDLRAAVESIVLLKNNGVLPLRRDHESILVTGPTAANTSALLGDYFGVSSRLITLLEGITESAAEGCRVVYRTGCPLLGPAAPGVNYTYPTAAESEITIAVLGLDPSLEGEEGDAVASPTDGDRDSIELPRVQLEFLIELRRHARKLVVVLTGGSAIAVPEAQDLADAVLQVWYPGCEGGRALADVLFGGASPSGKLPVTVPYRTADLPAFADYGMRGRTYRFSTIEPLYPFGFGLGYAKLEYGPLELGAPTLASGQEVALRTTVANVGSVATEEAVQCYVQPPREWPDAPRATLVDFQKIPVPAGSTARVEFHLPAGAFAQVDSEGRSVHVPGRYRLVVGSASPGLRAQALGAPAPATAEIILV